MEVIDGNAVASDLLEELAKKVQAFEILVRKKN